MRIKTFKVIVEIKIRRDAIDHIAKTVTSIEIVV